MFSQIFQRIISFGIEEKMEPSYVNRIKRINLYYMILFIMLSISMTWAAITMKPLILVLDSIMLLTIAAIFFLIPAYRKPGLNSLLILTLTGIIFLSEYIFDLEISGELVLAFYLLFPLASVYVNRSSGIYVPIGLGLITLVLNFVPFFEEGIHLDLYNSLVFFSLYTLVILISLYVERSNRKQLTILDANRSRYESQIVRSDEFISNLSHKLRTSLSNITLINNLVHDSRLTSEQMELVETLKASTNTLIEDVNHIVEIASPGNIDYKKSIISFDLDRVLEEAVSIMKSGPGLQEEVLIKRSDRINHFLIGDPGLLRSLVVNIVKGLSIYKTTGYPFELLIDNLRETSTQVRLEFRFKVESDLGKELASYMDSLRIRADHQGSSLFSAYKLLRESERGLSTSNDGRVVSVQFFQDFIKDPARSVIDPVEKAVKEKIRRKQVALKEAKVLLVEDNEINQKIVILSLSKRVNQIDVASNGKEALEMFGLKQYDLILMDIMMPVMDGITATRKIRETESTSGRHVPIIAITANALTGDRENCLAAGADHYIAKPFQADVLVTIMKNLLA